jgi:hypothetical protein
MVPRNSSRTAEWERRERGKEKWNVRHDAPLLSTSGQAIRRERMQATSWSKESATVFTIQRIERLELKTLLWQIGPTSKRLKGERGEGVTWGRAGLGQTADRVCVCVLWFFSYFFFRNTFLNNHKIHNN